jgi:hypothetical protein
MPPLLGIDDLAGYLNVSWRTVERLRAAGRLPRPSVKIGTMPCWTRECVRRFVEEGGLS